MRRLCGLVAAGAMVVGGSAVYGRVNAQQPQAGQEQQAATAQAASQTQQPARPKLTFEGDVVLWSIGVKPDKTADFEEVLRKLKEALGKSENPQARQQAAGWKVMRGAPDPTSGNVIYTHIIDPVVPGADYGVTENIYAVFKDPTEQRKYYDLYRGAFAQNFGARSGTIVVDMGKP